jgi:hypothetical protein
VPKPDSAGGSCAISGEMGPYLRHTLRLSPFSLGGVPSASATLQLGGLPVEHQSLFRIDET